MHETLRDTIHILRNNASRNAHRSHYSWGLYSQGRGWRGGGWGEVKLIFTLRNTLLHY